MLVRRDALARVGPFDERVRSFFEPADFALAVQQAGGEVYLEPRAVVTHTLPPPLPAADLPFFLLRWSNEWLQPTLRHFARKHGLSLDDPGLRHHWRWRSFHRRRALPPALWRMVCAPALKYPAKAVDRIVFDALLESTVVRPAERRRPAFGTA
jgi:cellulose synthase/poly-beta-1,6-N-acetylglucosamine synthase-like glycosyltransferase